jgi:hypothetical protein
MDIVLFAAGEVLQSCTPAGFLDDAQVDLESSGDANAHFRFASGEDFSDAWKFGEAIHDFGGGLANDEDIQIANGFFAASVASGEIESLDGLALGEVSFESLGETIGIIDPQAFGGLGDDIDILQNALLGFGSEPFKIRDATLQTGLFQGSKVHHTEFLVEFHGFLGSEAWDFHHIAERCWDFLAEFFQGWDRTGLDSDFGFLGERRADAIDRGEVKALGDEFLGALRESLDGRRAAAIGSYSEGVFAREL